MAAAQTQIVALSALLGAAPRLCAALGETWHSHDCARGAEHAALRGGRRCASSGRRANTSLQRGAERVTRTTQLRLRDVARRDAHRYGRRGARRSDSAMCVTRYALLRARRGHAPLGSAHDAALQLRGARRASLHSHTVRRGARRALSASLGAAPRARRSGGDGRCAHSKHGAWPFDLRLLSLLLHRVAPGVRGSVLRALGLPRQEATVAT